MSLEDPIIVRYWRGTTQVEEHARTYQEALAIADKNNNSCGPTFWHRGRELLDCGYGLADKDAVESSAPNSPIHLIA